MALIRSNNEANPAAVNPFQADQDYVQDTMNVILGNLDRDSLLNLSEASTKTRAIVLDYFKEITCPKIRKLMRFHFPEEQAEKEIQIATEPKDDWEFVKAHFNMLDKSRDERGNSLLHISTFNIPSIPYESKLSLEENNRIVVCWTGQNKDKLLKDLLEVHPDIARTNKVGMRALDIAKELGKREAVNSLISAGPLGIAKAESKYDSDNILWLYEDNLPDLAQLVDLKKNKTEENATAAVNNK